MGNTKIGNKNKKRFKVFKYIQCWSSSLYRHFPQIKFPNRNFQVDIRSTVVSHLVKQGTLFDVEASKLCTTVLLTENLCYLTYVVDHV